MNKKELVESVSIERNLTKKEAELLVDTVFNTITRKGISPKTQEEMIIPASKTVTFKPSNRLKDAMN